MTHSAKELAFLRDLYVSTDWTERFTAIIDENFKFKKVKNLLYLNAGSGNHTLELRRKLDSKSSLHAVCETKELIKISKAKSDVIKADVTFSSLIPAEIFDLVIADATFTEPNQINQLLSQTVNSASGGIAFLLPTAGSFGEIYSFLWETFFNLDLTDKGVEIERLISDLPSVSVLEDTAQRLGLEKVTTTTKVEFFDFKDGKEFIKFPLIANFLLPKWLAFLSEKERKKVAVNLAKVIDSDDRDLSFRFSVKATLLTGSKGKKAK